MKTQKKQQYKLFITLLTACFILTLSMPTFAASRTLTRYLIAYPQYTSYSIRKLEEKRWTSGYPRGSFDFLEYVADDFSDYLDISEATNITVSDPSVITLLKSPDEAWIVKAKKAGRSSVSFHYEGKTYTIYYIVQSPSNPFKKITVNGKKVSCSRFTKGGYICLKKRKYTSRKYPKIKIRLKSGWQLISKDRLKSGSDAVLERGIKLVYEYEIRNKATGYSDTFSIWFK